MTALHNNRGLLARGKQTLAVVIDRIWTLKCVLRHPRAPWGARIVAAITIMYLVSPIQIIPTFIPVIGQMDDLFVLYAGMKLIRRLTPDDVFTECERQAGFPILWRRVLSTSAVWTQSNPEV